MGRYGNMSKWLDRVPSEPQTLLSSIFGNIKIFNVLNPSNNYDTDPTSIEYASDVFRPFDPFTF